MSEYLGFMLAFIAAISWGTQFVPLKRIKNPDMLNFQVFMSVGIIIISVILTFILGFPFTINYFGLLAGVVWGIGNIFHITAVKNIGLAKGTAIPLGTSLIISFFFGSFFFNESFNFLLGLTGVIIFLIGLPFVTYTKEKLKTNKIGIIAAFVAGSLFGSILIFFKLGNLKPSEFLFPLSVGVILLGIILFLTKVRKIMKEYAYNGIASGIIWGIGMLSATYAVAFLGLAIGQPLTQLALLVAVLLGLFYFKEIKERKVIRMILIGAVLIFLAGILLAFSRILLFKILA